MVRLELRDIPEQHLLINFLDSCLVFCCVVISPLQTRLLYLWRTNLVQGFGNAFL